MVVETQDLPYVDEHAALVEANVERTWAALLRVAERSFSSPTTGRVARALGCVDTEASGPRPLAVGSTFPGFRVAALAEPSELALAGRHRFSDYALIFHLEALDANRTRLLAETRAEFPDVKGRVYRAMVLGTRGHVLVTRRLLGAVQRRAART